MFLPKTQPYVFNADQTKGPKDESGVEGFEDAFKALGRCALSVVCI